MSTIKLIAIVLFARLLWACVDGVASLIRNYRSQDRKPPRTIWLLALDKFVTSLVVMFVVLLGISFVESFFAPLQDGLTAASSPAAAFLMLLLGAALTSRWIRYKKGMIPSFWTGFLA